MVDKKNLEKEMFEWQQTKLEEGKFPCMCGHFANAHVKSLCIACHGDEIHSAPVHGEGFSYDSCFHPFTQMDNLTLIEWMAKNKKELL